MDWFFLWLFQGWRAQSEITRLRRQVLDYQIRLGEVPPPAPRGRAEVATVWILRKVFRLRLRAYKARVEDLAARAQEARLKINAQANAPRKGGESR